MGVGWVAYVFLFICLSRYRPADGPTTGTEYLFFSSLFFQRLVFFSSLHDMTRQHMPQHTNKSSARHILPRTVFAQYSLSFFLIFVLFLLSYFLSSIRLLSREPHPQSNPERTTQTPSAGASFQDPVLMDGWIKTPSRYAVQTKQASFEKKNAPIQFSPVQSDPMQKSKERPFLLLVCKHIYMHKTQNAKTQKSEFFFCEFRFQP